jgi:hypothetical protein
MKMILVDDGIRENLVLRIGKIVFESGNFDFSKASDAAEMISMEKPSLVLLNLEKPVNGNEDMMNMLSHYDSNVRLRVTFLEISPNKIIIFKTILNRLKDFYKNFFHINRGGKGMKEAFVRR